MKHLEQNIVKVVQLKSKSATIPVEPGFEPDSVKVLAKHKDLTSEASISYFPDTDEVTVELPSVHKGAWVEISTRIFAVQDGSKVYRLGADAGALTLEEQVGVSELQPRVKEEFTESAGKLTKVVSPR